MRNTSKIAAAFGATAVVTASLATMTMTTANAATVNGGCASFFVDAGTPITSSGGASQGYLGDPKGAWSDEATTGVIPDYTLTSSGGDVVGDTRNFSLAYSKGMKSFAPASGTQYWYFSVNGVMLPAVTNQLSVGTAVAPGATVTGSYAITAGGANNIVFEKMIFDASAGVRVVCSGQSGDTDALNSHTTPTATNVSTSFNASAIATATITNISRQATLTNARYGDTISFEASDFSAAGTGTAQICSTDVTPVCGGSSTFTVDANGEGAGTIVVPGAMFNPGAGNKELVLTSGSEKGKTPIRILGAPTMTTNVAAGGAGTNVRVQGTNWDPGQPVEISSYSGAGQTSTAVGTAKTVNAAPDGTIDTIYTVQSSATTAINALHPYRMGLTVNTGFVAPGNAQFTFSGDACTADVGANTADDGGNCALLETVELTVIAGDLKMSKVAGVVELSDAKLGEDITATGSLRDVTVTDERGGSLGWSLVGSFNGLDGAVDIPASALSWTPSCAPATGNDDTVVAGAAGAAFGGTALPLCSVASTGVGANGVSNGDTVADAALLLNLPVGQAAGDYVGTLTLTLS